MTASNVVAMIQPSVVEYHFTSHGATLPNNFNVGSSNFNKNEISYHSEKKEYYLSVHLTKNFLFCGVDPVVRNIRIAIAGKKNMHSGMENLVNSQNSSQSTDQRCSRFCMKHSSFLA